MLSHDERDKLREEIQARVRQRSDEVVEIALRLLSLRTETPPGDTTEIAQAIESILNDTTGI